MMIAIPTFIKLGFWQYNKAEQKQHLQQQYDRYSDAEAVELPRYIDDAEMWRYRRVRVTGTYDARHQVYLDNQIQGEQAGYHVLTPFVLDEDRVLLVNRGWIAGSANHQTQPDAEVPAGPQEITGQIWLPPKKFYSLETAEQQGATAYSQVWQNLDMERYAGMMKKTVYPVVLRLDKDVAGGYTRDWPKPAERITTHIGYAYQWFGFAFATVLIYLFVSFKKKSHL